MVWTSLLVTLALQEPLPPPPETSATTRTRIPVERSPSTLTVIDDDLLRDLGVRYLSDALRVVPGLEVSRTSSTESNVSARAYSDDSSASQGILGLVDGRQVYNEFFGGVLWDTLPVAIEDVAKVEVVRGPGSFVHGPNAMHGLVNIVTRSPLEYDADAVTLVGGGGTYRSSLASLTVVRREPDAALKVRLAWDDIADFEDSDRTARDKVFAEARLEVRLSPENLILGERHRLDLTAGASEQKFDTLIPEFAGVPTTRFYNEASEPYARALYVLDNLRVQAAWTRFDARSRPQGTFADFDVLVDTADLDAQFSLVVDDRSPLTAGAGYRYARFETEDMDVSGGSHDTGLFWWFLQGEIELARHELWLTAGVRMDVHSVAGTRTSPRAAVVWKAADGHFLRASGGTGFRNPSLRELWFAMPVDLFGPDTLRIVGNRHLDAEKLRSLELGYSGRLPGGAQAEAAAFTTTVDGLAEFRLVSAGPPIEVAPQNVGKEQGYGVELGLTIPVVDDALDAFANYSYGVRRDRDDGDRIPLAPLHKANAGVRLKGPHPALRATVWATFFDEIESIDTATGTSLGRVDAYVLLNARAEWRLESPRMAVYVQAFNVLDHDHREQPQAQPYGLLLVAGAELAW